MTKLVKDKLKKVISKLAPAKRIQIRRSTEEFKCPEAKESLKEANKAKTHAIKTRNQEDFRIARNMLETAKRINYIAESKHLKEELKNNKKKWKAVKGNDGEEKFPTALMDMGKLVTSQKEIAEVLANTFESKVKNIKDKFDANYDIELNILEN